MPWYPLSSYLWRAKLGAAALARPRDGSSGPEQVEAWTRFYLEEERSGRARPTGEFASMLVRHGCPDMGNPLPNDEEGHFLIHPGGFLAGEFDRILRPAETEVEVERGENALARLGLVAHLNCPMTTARAYWADEDLRHAMALACLEGRWDLFGARPARVLVNSLRLGLLEPMAASGLLYARLMAEEAWHQPFWRRGIFGPRQAAVEEAPPAPELDLAAWRARRQARPPSNSPEPSLAELPQSEKFSGGSDERPAP